MASVYTTSWDSLSFSLCAVYSSKNEKKNKETRSSGERQGQPGVSWRFITAMYTRPEGAYIAFKKREKKKKYHQPASCIFIRGDIFTATPIQAHDAQRCVCENAQSGAPLANREEEKEEESSARRRRPALVQVGSGTIHFSNSHNAFLWARRIYLRVPTYETIVLRQTFPETRGVCCSCTLQHPGALNRHTYVRRYPTVLGIEGWFFEWIRWKKRRCFPNIAERWNRKKTI